jgi:hypothetical protein
MVSTHRLSAGFITLLLAVGAQAAGKPAKPASKPAAHKAAPAQPAVAQEPQALSAEQLAIAERVHVGHIPCELSVNVDLQPHPTAAGHFVLDIARQRFVLSPVPTTTGAVRLEDAHAGAVWLQLANKSMLMNQKLGQRMADECMSPGQQQVAQALARTQTTGGGLLDAPKPAAVPVVMVQPTPGVATTAME